MRQTHNRIRFPRTRRKGGETHLKREELVWVQCAQFRCLAYKAKGGTWRSFYTGEELADFVRVIE